MIKQKYKNNFYKIYTKNINLILNLNTNFLINIMFKI